MEIAHVVIAQLVVLTAVCIGPVLGFGIRLAPARTSAGYVRRHLGER